jgi:hypothetical protein
MQPLRTRRELDDDMKVVRLRFFREVAFHQPSGDHELSHGGKFVVEAANEIVKALCFHICWVVELRGKLDVDERTRI